MGRLGLETSCIERDSFSEQGGADAATRLLTRCPGLTAVYTSTLSQAVGATHAVRALGRRIPEDLSVISYDDLPLADYLDPPLTTVAMPLLELGAAAVDALVEQLSGQPPRDVTIPTTPLVVARRSTGRPPARAADGPDGPDGPGAPVPGGRGRERRPRR